jgi:Pyruvate/2-oxoacid:ferredoxin oxidoreductase delta subunit
MSKRSNRGATSIAPHILELIRVTPEMTESARAKLKYTITPPEKSKAKRRSKKQLYCPYCAEYRIFRSFLRDGHLSYRKCTGCGISVEDFYVKNYNKLW